MNNKKENKGNVRSRKEQKQPENLRRTPRPKREEKKSNKFLIPLIFIILLAVIVLFAYLSSPAKRSIKKFEDPNLEELFNPQNNKEYTRPKVPEDITIEKVDAQELVNYMTDAGAIFFKRVDVMKQVDTKTKKVVGRGLYAKEQVEVKNKKKNKKKFLC